MYDRDRCPACGVALKRSGLLGVADICGERIVYMLCGRCSDRAQREPEAVEHKVERGLRRALEPA